MSYSQIWCMPIESSGVLFDRLLLNSIVKSNFEPYSSIRNSLYQLVNIPFPSLNYITRPEFSDSVLYPHDTIGLSFYSHDIGAQDEEFVLLRIDCMFLETTPISYYVINDISEPNRSKPVETSLETSDLSVLSKYKSLIQTENETTS